MKVDARHPAPVTRHSPRVTQLLAYATVLVAFFLRVYRLADKNIWWDEGWSLWLAQKDLTSIALRTAADEHPPLHYWLLHFWNARVGADAFSGRFLSIAFGVLTIALMYRIGKRVGGVWIGILASLFLAAARFHIWWSQDIKNYTPSIFFAFAAVWFALILLDKPNWKSVVGYALCAALAMWTHYLAVLVLLALNIYAAFVFLTSRHDGRELRDRWQAGSRQQVNFGHWLIANVLAATLFAPWMVLYLQNAAAWSAAPTFDFGLFLKLVATVLALGVTTHIENYAALTIALTILAALGCVPVISKQLSVNSKRSLDTDYWSLNTDYRVLFVLIVLLPPLLIYFLSLTPVAFFAPKIQARYLLILLPAYVMLLALGIALLKRLTTYLALAAALFVLASSAFVLNDYYANRRLRDEYTTLANTINSFARQGDLVLLDTDQEWPTFLYYLRAPLDWLGVPNGAAMNAANADTLVQRALARHDAVWLVAIPDALATDPQRLLEARLARELPKQFEQTFDDKRLALYAREGRELVQVIQANLYIQQPLPVVGFPNPADLSQLSASLWGFDLPVREVRAGDTLYLATYWNAVPTRGEIELYDSSGRLAHSTALDLLRGKNVRVVSEVHIPPSAVAGQYAVRVRVGARSVELARVHVEPRAGIAPAGAITNRVDYRLGDAIHLVGYDLPTTRFRAGESMSITLYWRADRAVEKDYVAFVHLRGNQFNPKHSPSNPLWGQVDRVPREGAYPTTAWIPSEIVPDAYRVPIDPRAPAGVYKIEIGLYDAATGTRLAVDGGQDSISIGEIEITSP